MPSSFLDHLVISAPTLEAGAAAVLATLGVPVEPGGQHLRMGTHNCLLRLGNALYLEVISIDPSAPRPMHPRWFQLDHVSPADTPRLCGWVARTDDILLASSAASHSLGDISAMSRGTLDWQISIPGDGSLPCDGIAPMLIQWRSGRHPASMLRDRGCTLARLEGLHPYPDRIRSILQSIGFQGAFVVSMPRPGEAPQLIAHIQTPSGMRRLKLPE